MNTPTLNIQIHTEPSGKRVIIVVLSSDALACNTVGDPISGISLSPSEARLAAQTLLQFAHQLDPL